MIRVIIKGKQGSGKTTFARDIKAMLQAQKTSFSVQDGDETEVHSITDKSTGKKLPVEVAIIVKQG